MSFEYSFTGITFEVLVYFKSKKMKNVFKSLIGMSFMIGLFLMFKAFIEFHAPELILVSSAVQGFVFIVLMMGMVIISKGVLDSLRNSTV